MDSEKLKYQIGGKIAELRRYHAMTQADLAEKLNYSDKAVSKWERGESVPDVLTLMQLAQVFGVSVDALVGNTEPDLPAEAARKPAPKRGATYKGVLRLSSLLVWLVALTVYVILSSCGVPKSWVAFVYAIAVNAIVLLCLCSAWGNFKWNQLLISVIMWGILGSIYISLFMFAGANVWRLAYIGAAGQLAIYLSFRMIGKWRQEREDG